MFIYMIFSYIYVLRSNYLKYKIQGLKTEVKSYDSEYSSCGIWDKNY